MKKIKLSVALATYNEEENLERCLDSVKDLADEIVIVDGSSQDNTVRIAQKYTDRVIVTTNKPIFHLNKQMAIDNCKGEWILQLDADEVISPELKEEIEKIIQNSTSKYDAYWVKRKKMFLGKWMKKGGQYPDPVIRFFKRGKAYLPCKSVHEQMIVNGKVGWLQHHLIHYPTPSFSVYILKDNRYSSLTARELLEKKISLNVLSFFNYFLWKPIQTFFSIYIWHKGFIDGFPGFVFAAYSGLHYFTAYVKYWEIKKNQETSVHA